MELLGITSDFVLQNSGLVTYWFSFDAFAQFIILIRANKPLLYAKAFNHNFEWIYCSGGHPPNATLPKNDES